MRLHQQSTMGGYPCNSGSTQIDQLYATEIKKYSDFGGFDIVKTLTGGVSWESQGNCLIRFLHFDYKVAIAEKYRDFWSKLLSQHHSQA